SFTSSSEIISPRIASVGSCPAVCARSTAARMSLSISNKEFWRESKLRRFIRALVLLRNVFTMFADRRMLNHFAKIRKRIATVHTVGDEKLSKTLMMAEQEYDHHENYEYRCRSGQQAHVE